MDQPVIGRVIGKRLTDELGDKVALIVDGIDGRTHHVALGDKVVVQDAPMRSIVEIGRTPAGPRASDRNIATIARDSGVYRPSEHMGMARGGRGPRARWRLCWLCRKPCPAAGGASPRRYRRASGCRPLVHPRGLRGPRHSL